MIYYVIALIIIVLDQASKWLIVHNLKIGQEVPVIGDFFVLTSHRNRGAAFSILQDQRLFFLLITLIAVTGIVIYLRKAAKDKRVLLASALGTLLGGALGNFIDRARFGEVVDFLQFYFNFNFLGWKVDYTFAIFNVADMAISIGVAMIVLDTFLDWRKERKSKHESNQPEAGQVD
ncbi:signal peptidase II [Gorillibacterium sp. CAU 1737]|uniref:signal peptidase II n=1 Tax=Gorillibacterium sp. CAU 1737 TaxID=3140362 RepID=UPI0032617B02